MNRIKQENKSIKINLLLKNMIELVLCFQRDGRIVLKKAANQKDDGSVNKYVTNAINKQLQTDGFSPMQKQITEPDRAEQEAEPMQEETT